MQSSAEKTPRNAAPARPLVLLVEDDSDTAATLAEVLEQEGYRVVVAKEGTQALRFLRETQRVPQLIVLDLMMPVMDGWEFRAEQKRIPGRGDIPVLIVSADGHARRHADDIGAVGYLRKPFDIGQLLDALQGLCPAGSD